MEDALSSEGQEAKVRALLAPMFDEVVSHKGVSLLFSSRSSLLTSLLRLSRRPRKSRRLSAWR